MRDWTRVIGRCLGPGPAWLETRRGIPGIDRAGDGPDAISDVLRRENAAAGVDGRTVLADARARRERALAYRATVYAVYAKAGFDAAGRSSDGHTGGNPAVGRLDLAEQYPDPYLRTADDPPPRRRPWWKDRRSLNSGLTSSLA